MVADFHSPEPSASAASPRNSRRKKSISRRRVIDRRRLGRHATHLRPVVVATPSRNAVLDSGRRSPSQIPSWLPDSPTPRRRTPSSSRYPLPSSNKPEASTCAYDAQTSPGQPTRMAARSRKVQRQCSSADAR
ncbi:hypothetical protein FA13DRAFT_174599 [Coprinellus micaceus]|uniref:Uncharacterized protein n=1 Tax=Coprinellus micaceus TaxID=71717 RepID=A0A4Y7SG73_COPMI|nr:hypothetical protein FA13DRAFT_174599 [Coprinellus micaceus]